MGEPDVLSREAAIGNMVVSRDSTYWVERLVANMLGRHWLGARFKGGDGLVLLQLMLAVHRAHSDGLLLTMKDAMRAVGADHITTAQRYVAVAQELGHLETKREEHRAVRDQRMVLLVPTKLGLVTVDREIEQLKDWVGRVARMGSNDQGIADHIRAALSDKPRIPIEEMDRSLPSDLLTDGELMLVSGTAASEQALPGGARFRTFSQERTVRRWIEAYSETLRLVEDNIPALTRRLTCYEWTGQWQAALDDAVKLEALGCTFLTDVKARLKINLERYDDALSDLDQLVDKKVLFKSYAVWWERARAFYGKRDYEAALIELARLAEEWKSERKKALLAEAEFTEAGDFEWVRLRGLCYEQLGNTSDAVRDFEACREMARQELKESQELLASGEKGASQAQWTISKSKQRIVEMTSRIENLAKVVNKDGVKAVKPVGKAPVAKTARVKKVKLQPRAR